VDRDHAVAPLLLGLARRVLLPAVVVELLAGIVLGPSVLGWIVVDGAVEVLALLGLAFLLFLAGLEIEPDRLRGAALRLALAGFFASFALALVLGGALARAGIVREPLFLAVVLSATALGVIVRVLKDARRLDTDVGQLVIVSATVADLATIVSSRCCSARTPPGRRRARWSSSRSSVPWCSSRWRAGASRDPPPSRGRSPRCRTPRRRSACGARSPFSLVSPPSRPSSGSSSSWARSWRAPHWPWSTATGP
jgi:hypothetical protein